MTTAAEAFEAYLARLYTDADERARFLRDPRSAASAAGLDGAACDALGAIDRVGLELAARSYAHKRGRRARFARRGGLFARVSAALRTALPWR